MKFSRSVETQCGPDALSGLRRIRVCAKTRFYSFGLVVGFCIPQSQAQKTCESRISVCYARGKVAQLLNCWNGRIFGLLHVESFCAVIYFIGWICYVLDASVCIACCGSQPLGWAKFFCEQMS